MAGSTIWHISYDIRKVNGEPFNRAVDTFRGFEEEIPRLIKMEAENMADRYDFAYVKIVAKDLNSNQRYEFVHKTEEGFRDEWHTRK